MATRLNEILLFIGRKGTGKTTRAIQLAKATNKKIIVLDDLVHPAYDGFETIHESDLHKWKGKHARLMFDSLDSTLNTLSHYQTNAVIIIEDSSRYISANVSKAVTSFIINHRKFDFDVYFMFHFLNDVPPYLCKQYGKLVLFKTGDNIEVKQQKWSNWHSILKKLEKALKHKNYNHCEIVSIDE